MSDRLTALDASFLHLEDGSSHMHVAGVSIFEGEPPELRRSARAHRAAPLARAALPPEAALRPLGQGRPVWVDDPHFNLRYHVRATALPPPGSEEQLKNLASRVFAQQLDRTKPLWEIWLVEGLGRKDGASPPARTAKVSSTTPPPRFALLSKTHHALVDGVAGVDITAVLFDTAADPETPPGSGLDVGAATGADVDAAARRRAARARDPARRDRALRALRLPRAAPARLEGHRQPRGRRRAGADRPRRSPHPAERRRSARTAASTGSARTWTRSRRSRTRSAARSTTSSSRS